MGNRALYLNGASSEAALGVRAGYFLQWAIVRWLRETVARRWYDLHGTMSTPGVRQFKKGLAGPKVPEITMHEYEACESPLRRGLVAAGARLSELNRKPVHRRSGRV